MNRVNELRSAKTLSDMPEFLFLPLKSKIRKSLYIDSSCCLLIESGHQSDTNSSPNWSEVYRVKLIAVKDLS